MCSSGLPELLRPQNFEPLDPPETTRTGDVLLPFQRSLDLLDFNLRVERLAEEYWAGRNLFIPTASLRGPFESKWKNPWMISCEELNKPKKARKDTKNKNKISKDKNEDRSLSQTKLTNDAFGARISKSKHGAQKKTYFEKRVKEIQIADKLSIIEEVDPNEVAEGATHGPAEIKKARIPLCAECEARSTSKWRKTPLGKDSLCNKCYHRNRKRRIKSEEEQRKAAKNLETTPQGTGPGKHIVTGAGITEYEGTEAQIVDLTSDGDVSGQKASLEPTFVGIASVSTHDVQAHPTSRRFSQPELGVSNANKFSFPGSSSFPGASAHPKLHHKEVMKEMFPGGLEAIAQRQNPSHVGLKESVKGDFRARMRESLMLPPIIPNSKKSKNFTNKAPVRGKKREMTFDTPIVERRTRRRRDHAKEDLATANDAVVEWGNTIEGSKIKSYMTEIGNENAQVDENRMENWEIPDGQKSQNNKQRPSPHKRVTGSFQEAGASPYMSTQTAMLQAHVAFQNVFDSPIVQTSATSPSKVLQEKKNAMLPTSPVNSSGSTQQDAPQISSSQQKDSYINTQALFDAFTERKKSPGTASSKKSRKRASFAADLTPVVDPNSPAGQSMPEDTPLTNRGTTVPAKSSLRKSALKNSSSLPASSDSLAASASRGRGKSGFKNRLSFFTRDMDEGADGENEVAIESFLEDADSFLRP